MIKFVNIAKAYKTKKIYTDLNVTLEDSKVVGLVGNNGVGKTTLFNMIMGYAKPTQGSIIIDGLSKYNDAYVAKKIALIDEKVKYCVTGKLKKIIDAHKQLDVDFDVNICYKVMQILGLDDNLDVRKLSKGMRGQFNIAIGFASSRETLLFDEPVAGLDEISRYRFYEMLKDDEITKGRLIIVSTHLLGELANVCDKILLIVDSDNIIYADTDNFPRMLIKIAGDIKDIEDFIKGREYYDLRTLGRLCSCIIDGDISYKDKKVIEENRIEVQQLSVNEVCRILTNKECFRTVEAGRFHL